MAISAAAAPNSWSSPAKNVWLVDARPRDIVYRETRAVVTGKLNWCYLSVSAFFVFATIFPLTLLLPQVPFAVCFFNGSSTLFISFVVFCRVHLFWCGGDARKVHSMRHNKILTLFREKHHQRCRGCYKKSVS